MGKPTAPSGLAISRSGTAWTLTWKRGKDYTSQNLNYSINGGGWTGLSVGKKATSAVIWAAATSVAFQVRGKKSQWSSWTTSGTYYVAVPYPPSVNAELTQPFVTKFSYGVSADDTWPQQFTNSEWQTILVKDCNTTDGNAVNWAGAETGTSGIAFEKTVDEGGFSGAQYSYTRWFRARSNGWAGSTGWVYANHVYATPKRAENVTGKYELISGSGYSVSVEWDSPASSANPIDSVTVQYLISPPATTVTTVGNTKVMTLSCPNTDQGWTSLTDVSGTSGKRAMSFTIPTDLSDDECVFVRVNNKHDQIITYGEPVLVSGSIGKLAKPSISSVSPGGVTNLYTVSVTRNTSVDNAFIAVYLRTTSQPNLNAVVGIIPANSTSVSCIIPPPGEDEVSFGVKAYIANYSPIGPQSESAPTYYIITDMEGVGRMESEINWDGGAVPLPPTNVSIIKVNDTTAQIGWNWSWRDANEAELSWADHEDAWESTDEPSTYIVGSTNASRWNIAGLNIGTWYFRIRLIKAIGEAVSYGTYCETRTLKLSSSPDTPALVLSDGVISKTGSVTCYWAYVSTDGTAQMYAEVCEAFYEYSAVTNPTGSPFENGYYELSGTQYVKSYDITVTSGKTYYTPNGSITYGDPIGSTNSSQHITLSAEEMNWQPNETHHLAVRVIAASGEPSEGWSAPVPVTIAEEITAQITISSLVSESETISEPGHDPITRTFNSLKSLPMTVKATGAGISGTTAYIIERSVAYHMARPDESEHEGFEGETVVIKYQNGEDPVTIYQEDLLGYLDDGASYRLIAIAKDSYGQTSQDSIEFEVHWTHQAVIPEATIELDRENNVTMITPIQPEGYASGDVADIYRLSVDTPELIVKGAEFGTKYVDPYPAFGEFGGHRIVYRTKNGDYITEDNDMAWTDYNADENSDYKHDLFGVVIDFDDEQLILPYNVSLSNSWTKDFTKTKYLGGSIQGDWNPSVEKSASASTTIPIEVEPDKVEALRRLAVFPGICHVRTPDGSSYTANIDVKDDREEKWVRRISKVSLTITRVDAEGFDGVTYAEWIRDQADEEQE